MLQQLYYRARSRNKNKRHLYKSIKLIKCRVGNIIRITEFRFYLIKIKDRLWRILIVLVVDRGSQLLSVKTLLGIINKKKIVFLKTTKFSKLAMVTHTIKTGTQIHIQIFRMLETRVLNKLKMVNKMIILIE